MATKAREHTLQPRPVDHAMGGTASAASPNVQHLPNPQPSDTADPMSSVEATSHAILARTVSAPATATKRRNTERTQADPAPRGKGRLPYHPTAQPKEKLPEGNPVPSFEKMFKGLLQPTRPVGDAPSVPRQLRNIATYSWLNVLLLFVPVSWAVHFTHQSSTVVFVFSFIATIPLALLVGFASGELNIRVGHTMGTFLGVTFRNTFDLIIAIVALRQGQLRVIQASLLGSVLSNLLLVLGMCFFVGGLKFHEQRCNFRVVQTHISLLSIAVFSIILPAAFHTSMAGRTGSSSENTVGDKEILAISRGTSVVLLVVYAAYLLFQLWTHAYVYTAEASKKQAAQEAVYTEGVVPPCGQRVFRMPHIFDRRANSPQLDPEAADVTSNKHGSRHSNDIEEEEEPRLSIWGALLLLVVATIIGGVTAGFIVNSIQGVIKTGRINEKFIPLIILPIIGNAAGPVGPITASRENRLDLAMSVAVGSPIQVSLFVFPVLVVLGWIMGQPLSFFFNTFETLVTFGSIIIVNYLIAEGRTHWLAGFILMVTYAIIALAIWFYPGI